jgi:hypothetical protein
MLHRDARTLLAGSFRVDAHVSEPDHCLLYPPEQRKRSVVFLLPSLHTLPGFTKSILEKNRASTAV